MSEAEHGATRYRNAGCRCDVCRAGATAAQAERRAAAQRRGLAPGDDRHGTPNGYSYWGCRCAACTEVMRAKALQRNHTERTPVQLADEWWRALTPVERVKVWVARR